MTFGLMVASMVRSQELLFKPKVSNILFFISTEWPADMGQAAHRMPSHHGPDTLAQVNEIRMLMISAQSTSLQSWIDFMFCATNRHLNTQEFESDNQY